MKKAAPYHKQSSPTRLKINSKQYATAIVDALPAILSGLLILAALAWVLGVLA